MLSIIEILKLRGLDSDTPINLIRHQDQRYNLYDLMIGGHIDTYQSYQSKDVFNCKYIITFFGLPGNKARLLGVYEVGEKSIAKYVKPPSDFPIEIDPSEIHYKLVELPGFEDLKERVLIDWGKSTRAWHQWLVDKEVLEILPKGYARPFPGYLDFLLPFEEMKRICEYPDANREWHTSLMSVSGIYLIVNQEDGAQYVGSAHGAKGIFGRWEEYAQTRHGGNKRLIELLNSKPNAYRSFQFSILRTLSKSLTSKEVIEYENFYKEKPGTRAFGLNDN